MRALDMATAPRRDSVRWAAETTDWLGLARMVETPAAEKACGNYVLGRLRGDRRGKATIESRSAVTLDADSARGEDIVALLDVLGWQSIVHTTYSSTPEHPRYRVILLPDRDLAPDEYVELASRVMDMLGREQFDEGSTQPERYMFRPSAADPSAYRYWILDGSPVPVNDLLKGWDRDLRNRPDPGVSARKRDPFALDGVVGAFNRVYADFDHLIESYGLPYERAGSRRWHLVGASAEAGLSQVADGLVYSHHAHDPAYVQTCSAFDLVRLHRFSELDEDTHVGTPVNRLPSHAAMCELASKDAAVVAELVGDEFAQKESGWQLDLTLNNKTGAVLDSIKNWDLIMENDQVFGVLCWNELTMSVEILGDLPWRIRDGNPTFTGSDRSALYMHLERQYRVRPPRYLVDDMVAVVAARRRVNPLREYLLSVEWDGTPRVETCLPGVVPTPYTRAVARKVLTAAVARVLDPGCKWDHTLVLYGDEGMGKTWWVDRMALGYSAALGRISDKDTLLTMQRSWIMLNDEGTSLRKAEAEAQKEFLTRRYDVFRLPYERETMAHPRHCVIWSTTNDETFLRRQEGNRRFLIVRCQQKVDFDALTEEYVAQVWAEAVHLYRSGETLYLDDAESALASAERERYVEEDALGGLILAYLDTPVPAEWDRMSPDARIQWRQAYTDGMAEAGPGRIGRVCSAQIWVEALGRRIGDHRRADLLEITTALRRLPGWRALDGRVRLPGYGPQLTFERVREDEK